MDEKTLRALVDAGAVKQVSILANGTQFYIEIVTPGGTLTASTLKGDSKMWRSLDAAAKWVRPIGIGQIQLNIAQWQPGQKALLI